MMRRELDTRITSFGEKVSLIWYSDSGRVELEVEDREGGFVRAVPGRRVRSVRCVLASSPVSRRRLSTSLTIHPRRVSPPRPLDPAPRAPPSADPLPADGGVNRFRALQEGACAAALRGATIARDGDDRRPGGRARAPSRPFSTRRGTDRPRSCSRARRGSASRRSGTRASSTRARSGFTRPRVAARPRRSAALAHVGLGDLLEDVLDEVLPALLAPRRRALEVALLREEAVGRRRSISRALAVAVRDALRAAQRARAGPARDRRRPVARPVVVASALAFALRRLGASRVRLLLARRRRRGRGSRRSSSARSVPDASGALPVGPAQRRRAAPASARPARHGASRARRCSGSTSGRAGTRSSRWSWPASCSTRTSTRSSRCAVPETLESSSARGSRRSRRRLATRSRSPRRWARPRSRSWSGRASPRTRSTRRSPRT